MEKLYAYSGIIFGGIIAMLGGVDNLLVAVGIFIILDFATGILASMFSGRALSSKIGTKGIIRKLSYFVLIIFAQAIDFYVLQNSDFDFRKLAIGLIIYNEGVSIIENLDTMGVPIPDKLIKFFKNMKESDKNG